MAEEGIKLTSLPNKYSPAMKERKKTFQFELYLQTNFNYEVKHITKHKKFEWI